MDDSDILYEVKDYAEMHPALDEAQGSLYVAVLVNTKSRGLVPYLLKSVGGSPCQVVHKPYEQWDHTGRALKTQGLDLSYATPQLRWNGAGLKAALNGELLEVPTFPQVYQTVRSKLAEYLVADEQHLTLAALHVLLTYYHPLFDKLPILWCYALQGVGKSRLAEAVAYLSFNGMVTSTATRSTIFRTADAGRYTQALTEMDVLTATQSGETLVTDFHGCTSPGEAWVAVAEQDNGKGRYKPVRYYGYSPRILCTTVPLKSGPLLSRCVRLDIQAKNDPDMDKLDRTLKPDNLDLYDVRDMLYRVQLGRWSEVQEAYQAAKATWRGADAPKGRPRDKWLPMMALATLTGDGAAIETVKQLAAKDTREFFKSRGDTLDAYLMRFAALLASKGDLTVTRKELWRVFVQDGWEATGHVENDPNEADWGSVLGLHIELDWLKRGKAGGPQKLVDELQRLKLLSAGRQDSKNTYYTLPHEQIYDQVTAHLGADVAAECEHAFLPWGWHTTREPIRPVVVVDDDDECDHANLSMSGRCLDCGKQVEERQPSESQRQYLRNLCWPDEVVDQMPYKSWKGILDSKERCPEDPNERQRVFKAKCGSSVAA
jgi:hypothetical protein